jgi:hypothetical protein
MIAEPLCSFCTLKKCSAQPLQPEKVDVLIIVDSPDQITVGAPRLCPMLAQVKKLAKPLMDKYGKTAKVTYGVSCPTLDNNKEHRSFTTQEFLSCFPRLKSEIELCNPSSILLLGDFNSAYPDDAENKPVDFVFTQGLMEFDIPVIAVPNILRPSKSFGFGRYQLVAYGFEKVFKGPGIRYRQSDKFPYILHKTVESFIPYYEARKDNYYTIDIETIGPEKLGLNPRAHIISCLGIRLDGINHILEAGAVAQGKELLVPILTDDCLKIGANLAYEHRSFAFHIGCSLSNMYDIQLHEYGAIRETGPYRLDFLARLYTDCDGWKDDVDYAVINEKLYEYLARDLVYTEDVYNAQPTILGRTS